METISVLSKISVKLIADDISNTFSDFDMTATDENIMNFVDAVNSLQNNPYDSVNKTTHTILL